MKINPEVDMSMCTEVKLRKFTPRMYFLWINCAYDFLQSCPEMQMKFCLIGYSLFKEELLALSSSKEELLMHADLLGIEIKDCTFEEAN